MSAHDQVANKEYPLQSVATTEFGAGAQYTNEQALRIVCIEKKSDPLVSLWSIKTVYIAAGKWK